MVAMSLFGASVVGIIALQKASIVGNEMARDRTTATNLAEYLITELSNESLAYVDLDTFDNSPLMRDAASMGQGMWVNFAGVNTTNRVQDLLHHSGQTGYENARFCMHYRMTDAGPPDSPGEIYRVDVRVLWWKPGMIPTNWKDCATLFDGRNNVPLLQSSTYELMMNKVIFRHPKEVQ